MAGHINSNGNNSQPEHTKQLQKEKRNGKKDQEGKKSGTTNEERNDMYTADEDLIDVEKLIRNLYALQACYICCQ